jgi:YD repeat-containing protein
MIKTLSVVLSCLPFVLSAQILDSYRGDLLDGECIFNADFLAKNKIKSITGKISTKRQMQPITRDGTIERYLFTKSGQLQERIKTFRMRGGIIDTTQDYFAYNDLQHLVAQTSYNLGGYNSTRYNYNSEGQIVKETHLRGENTASYSYQLQKGKETILKEEGFEYQSLTDTSFKRIYMNSAGKPYKSMTVTKNSLGQLLQESTRYYLTNKKHNINYEYDVKGRLAKIIDYSNLLGVQTTTYQFEYDEYDNLYSSKIYKDGKLLYSKEFLYNVQTFLLKAQLTKDESTNSIRIIQYEYEFY